MPEPVRMCVICRCRMAKSELVRHVVSSEGKMVRDDKAVMPGRGSYVCSKEECLRRFEKFMAVRTERGGRSK